MTTDDYADLEGLNWSSLRHAASSLLLYRWRQTHPVGDSAAMLLGRAIHCAILEPGAYHERYAEQPEGLDRRTRAGREWSADVGDREILTAAQAATLRAAVRSVAASDAAQAALEGCETEVPLQWIAEGIPAKGRVDAIRPDLLVDLKTHGSDLRGWDAHSARMLYHAQLSWYQRGAMGTGHLDADAEVVALVVQTCEPYEVAVLRYPSWVLEVGRQVWRDALAAVRVAEHTGHWPGVYDGRGDVDLPRWADPAAEYLP